MIFLSPFWLLLFEFLIKGRGEKKKTQPKHTPSLKENFRVGIFYKCFGWGFFLGLFAGTYVPGSSAPRCWESRARPPRSQFSPAVPGSVGQFATQPLVQQISEQLIFSYIYIFIFFFLLYFCTRLSHGRSPAGCCPGTLTAACSSSINHSRADATPPPALNWVSPGFMGCMWPQEPLVLPPLHPQTSSPYFYHPLRACWRLVLCPEVFLSSLSSAGYRARVLEWELGCMEGPLPRA